MFWQSTLWEIAEVLKRVAEERKEAYRRAGLIAATIVNVNRKAGTPLVDPDDFLILPSSEEDYMTVEAAASELDSWAAEHNRERGLKV